MVEEERRERQLNALYLAPSPGRIWRYGPLIVWATLIFIGSSDLLSAAHTSTFIVKPLRLLFPNASNETLAVIHFFLRKLGHFTEYAILGFLAARALRGSSNAWWRHKWFIASLVFVVLYALSDEFHQIFVPTRTASIYDSMIDSLGGLTALAIIAWRQRASRLPTIEQAARFHRIMSGSSHKETRHGNS